MANIFISYSRADRPYVDQLVPLLRRAFPSHHFWFDEQLIGGDDWWKRILDEIHDCDLFIYLLTNDSLTSEYCNDEFRAALRQNKPVLPVISRSKTDVNNAPDDIAQALKSRHWVDLSQMFADAGAMASLFAAVDKAVSVKTPALEPDIALTAHAAETTSSIARQTPPIWRLGMIAGVVIIVLIAIAVMGQPQNPDTSNTGDETAVTVIPSATNTPLPTSTDTLLPPSATTTLLPTSTDTPLPPTETNTPISPTPLPTATPYPTSEVISDVQVRFRDDFDGDLSNWNRWNNGSTSDPYTDGGHLIFEGGNWDVGLERCCIRPDGGSLLLFQYTGYTTLGIDLQSGTYGTSAFREWGLAHLNGFLWTIKSRYGNDDLVYHQQVSGFQADTWYYLLFRVVEQGHFQTYIWERDNPRNYLAQANRRFSTEEWDSAYWKLSISTDIGEFIADSYEELIFPDGFEMPSNPSHLNN